MEPPLDVIKIVASYLVDPKMKLLDWIPKNMEYVAYFGFPYSVHMRNKLRYNNDSDITDRECININIHRMTETQCECLYGSPTAICYFEKNMDEIDWSYLSFNPNALHLLEANLDKINWACLSRNPKAIHLLEPVILNIDNPLANAISWDWLSGNPRALHLLKSQPDKINWYQFSKNPNIYEIDMKQYNIDIINKANILDNLL